MYLNLIQIIIFRRSSESGSGLIVQCGPPWNGGLLKQLRRLHGRHRHCSIRGLPPSITLVCSPFVLLSSCSSVHPHLSHIFLHLAHTPRNNALVLAPLRRRP
jgi:hypothetical protein